MIHNIDSSIFNLPLEDYTLTFDDGTHDHYEYFEQFKSVNTQKYYFIIAERIGTEGYLSLDETKEMMQDPQIVIGGHSYSHTRLNQYSKLTEKIAYIRHDTNLMVDWFKTNLQFMPTAFCFPYNEDIDGLYQSVLRRMYSFSDFYGHERIPVETLLHTDCQ